MISNHSVTSTAFTYKLKSHFVKLHQRFRTQSVLKCAAQTVETEIIRDISLLYYLAVNVKFLIIKYMQIWVVMC